MIFIPLKPVEAFEIYDEKKITLDLDITLGLSCFYAATLLPGKGGFELTESKISFEGEYDKDLDFKLSADFSEINGEDDDKEILKDAYLRYSFSDYFRLKSGRYDIPLGEESQRGQKKRPNMFHSEGADLISPGRSLGVSISGKDIFDMFSYSLGVFNASGDIASENESGHFLFSGNIGFEKDFFQTGYSASYSTDEVFNHGVFMLFDFEFNDDVSMELFTEYMEQRFFNYHWNHSVYALLSLRVRNAEPLLYFDYFNDKVGYDGIEDKWIVGLGSNFYFLKDRLKLMTDLHSNYLYSLQKSFNLKFYDTKLTVKLVLSL